MNNVRATYYCKWVVPQGAPAQLPVQVRSTPSVIYHLAGPPAPKWFRPSDWGRRAPPNYLSLWSCSRRVSTALRGADTIDNTGDMSPRAGACEGGRARSIRVEECCRGSCVDCIVCYPQWEPCWFIPAQVTRTTYISLTGISSYRYYEKNYIVVW